MGGWRSGTGEGEALESNKVSQNAPSQTDSCQALLCELTQKSQMYVNHTNNVNRDICHPLNNNAYRDPSIKNFSLIVVCRCAFPAPNNSARLTVEFCSAINDSKSSLVTPQSRLFVLAICCSTSTALSSKPR